MPLTEEQFQALNPLVGKLRLPYCPYEPTPKQEFFLLREEFEVFFGGAAGPGKSWALLMAALQYVDIPGYNALLVRPSLQEFSQQGGLIEVAHDWLGSNEANAPKWNGGSREWTFASGAKLKFGYLANLGDTSHYKGGAVSFVGFDELTSFPEVLYRYMFRLLRQARGKLPGVPTRMRSTSNPGGIGHNWVKDRFINPLTRLEDTIYIPARMRDNPYLDVEQYLVSLAQMAPVDRERLINGDWDVAEEGSKFHRVDFLFVNPIETQPPVKQVRYWDLAGTAPTMSNPDPDYTVGIRYEVDAQGFFTIRDIQRAQLADHKVEELVFDTAVHDGVEVDIYIEQDPGQAGVSQLSNYKRHVLQGFSIREGSTRINGVNAKKEVRARPVAAAVGNHLVRILHGCPNTREFLDEVTMFPNAPHDDCVDALSGAHNIVTGQRGATAMTVHAPKGRIPSERDRLALRDLYGGNI